ncbi:MAG: LptF/LptG family permease [Candidatus Babeliales bacterium]
MILARYIFRRFFAYVGWTTLLLALIFALIELCEKMVRAQQVGVWAVVQLVGFNFIPSFFDIMPLASWIATLFFIKELYQQDEWTTVSILSISQKTILRIFFAAGLMLCCIHAIARETIALPCTAKAERFKQEVFKKQTPRTLLHQWLMLDATTLCHYNVLDTKKMTGSGLLIISMTAAGFIAKQTVTAPRFHLDQAHQSITLPEGVSFNTQTGQSTPIAPTTMHLPSFFSQLNITTEPPLLKNIMRHLIYNKNILPESVKNDLLAKLFKQLSASLLLLIYPLLTLCLFFLAATRKPLLAVLPLLPYPLLLVTTTAADIGIAHGAPAIVTLVPIACAGACLLGYYLYLTIQEGKFSNSNLKK